MGKSGYVYILTNPNNRVLYVGVTSDLTKRLYEHRSKLVKGFTRKYHCEKLVYYADCGGIEEAIHREKQLKGGSRAKKITLIEGMNPGWDDLTDRVYG